MYLEERVAKLEVYFKEDSPLITSLMNRVSFLEKRVADLTSYPTHPNHIESPVVDSPTHTKKKYKVYPMPEFSPEEVEAVFRDNFFVDKNGCWVWTGGVVSGRNKGPEHPVMNMYKNLRTRRLFARAYSFKAKYPDLYNQIASKSIKYPLVAVTNVCSEVNCVNPEHLVASRLKDYWYLVQDFNEGKITLANRVPVYNRKHYWK
jgi:hypothetical protein